MKLFVRAMSPLIAAAFLALPAPAADPTATVPDVRTAEDFVASIGVNTHVMYSDSSYADLGQMIAALRYLGITQLRDHAVGAPGPNTVRYGNLADAGYRFDFIVLSTPVETTQNIAAFLKAHPHSVAAIEGPNEINNWPIKYGGKTKSEAGVLFQQDLYKAVKADKSLAGIPVYNFTDYPQPYGAADAYNAHVYPKWGQQPYGYLQGELTKSVPPLVGKDRVITEGGYVTLANPELWKGPLEWSPVDPHQGAVFTLNYVFDAFLLGAKRTYLYQLFDAYPDPKLADADRHLGLFGLDYQPKPAATALRNVLHKLTNDADGGSAPYPTAAIQITGQATTTHAMVLKRSNGGPVLALWNEPQIWNASFHKPVAAAPVELSITLANKSCSAVLYNPIQDSSVSLNPIQNRLTVTLREEPMLLLLRKC